ncbi:uncharacterized protein TCAP_03029 [Tolypocladium capitatum]|uniref:2EXR domain-containing protein n=1 Tax=Tolypocladium capitatum TaxID=45235 RepID=A0A2K3QHK2_9HYPO|nr:uncharacterized protein TCAP_03029 [Tolypocladium capitatum]
MEPESYPLFPKFPLEVRELIWDLAVRPVPGKRHVHSFIVVDHYFNPDNPSRPVAGDFLRFGAQGELNPGFKLAVPRSDETNGRNSSVYLTDSGLWMACRESRAAMERRFRKNEWWSDMSGTHQPRRLAVTGDFLGQEDAAHTASYAGANGDAIHITIQPERDLAYFCPLELYSLQWYLHYAGNDVPLIDYRGDNNAPAKPSFLGLHVAFDYDPSMLDAPTTLVDMIDVFHESAGRTMWFVDRRLRRRSATATDESSAPGASDTARADKADDDRVVFRSDGHVFTEVRREDLSEWTMDDDGGSTNTVFDFFDRLHQQYDGRLEVGGSDRMKVLACEAAPA